MNISCLLYIPNIFLLSLLLVTHFFISSWYLVLSIFVYFIFKAIFNWLGLVWIYFLSVMLSELGAMEIIYHSMNTMWSSPVGFFYKQAWNVYILITSFVPHLYLYFKKGRLDNFEKCGDIGFIYQILKTDFQIND